MSPQDQKHLDDIKALLNHCPTGKATVAYLEKHNIPVEFDTGSGGACWNPKEKKIYIDRSKPADMAGLSLVHEVNHAEWQIEGRLADAKKLDQPGYVHKRLEEETAGTVKAIHAQKELQALGHQFPRKCPYYGVYSNASNAAEAEYLKSHPHATAQQLHNAAEKGGHDAVLKEFTDGNAKGSRSHRPYTEIYAEGWQRQNPGLSKGAAAEEPGPSHSAPNDWWSQMRHAAGGVLQSADHGLEPYAKQLKAAQDFSKRAADAIAVPTKTAIRNGLQGANDALNGLPMQEWKQASRNEADKWERFAKDSGLEDTANAVQMAEGGVWVWKGGVKVFQTLKNPEVRAALANTFKRAPDAAETWQQMKTRMSAFKGAQNEQRAAEAVKVAQSPAVQQAEKGSADHVKDLMAMRREALTNKITDDANRLLEKIHPDRKPGWLTKEGLPDPRRKNPTNCHSCTVATYFKFHGKDVIAASDHLPLEDEAMEKFFQARLGPAHKPEFQKMDGGIGEIIKKLEDGKHGDCGVIGYNHPGRRSGHVLFAANVNGRVVLMDGQAGRVLNLHEVSGKLDYIYMELPPPHPGAEPVIGIPVPPPVPKANIAAEQAAQVTGSGPHLPDGGNGLPPGGRPPSPPRGGEPPRGPGGLDRGPTPFGMRPQDMEVFQDAARKNNQWILVRHTNPESLQYIGEPGYTPKRIDCKANTANVAGHEHAGLVVDPHIHPDAYQNPAAAQAKWDAMHRELPDGRKVLPEGYSVDRDPASPRFGCLQHEGKYIHGDYDIYDMIDPKRPGANLGLVTELHGERHIQTPKLPEVGNYVNDRVGAPMVRHGGELQYRDHSEQRIIAFGPQGQRFELNGEQEIRDLYSQRFPGRRGFDHAKALGTEIEGHPPTGKGSSAGHTSQVQSMAETQPPSPGLMTGKDRVGGLAPKLDAVQEADKLAAKAVAQGHDPHLAARNVEKGRDPETQQKSPDGGFSGPNAGRLADADYRKRHDAAQFVARNQQDEDNRQQREAKLKAERDAHETKMREKFDRDTQEASKKQETKAEEEKKAREKQEDERKAEEKKEQSQEKKDGQQADGKSTNSKDARSGESKGSTSADSEKSQGEKDSDAKKAPSQEAKSADSKDSKSPADATKASDHDTKSAESKDPKGQAQDNPHSQETKRADSGDAKAPAEASKTPAQHDDPSDATKTADSKDSKATAGTNKPPDQETKPADSKDSKPPADPAKSPAQHDAHSDATKSPDSKDSKAPAGTNRPPDHETKSADSKDAKPTAEASKTPAQHDAHSDATKSPDSKDSKPPAGTNRPPDPEAKSADSKDAKPRAQHDTHSDATKSTDSKDPKAPAATNKPPDQESKSDSKDAKPPAQHDAHSDATKSPDSKDPKASTSTNRPPDQESKSADSKDAKPTADSAKSPAQHDVHSDATKSPDSRDSKVPASTNKPPDPESKSADSKDTKPTADSAKSPAQHDVHSDATKSPDSKDSKPPASTNKAPDPESKSADSKESKPQADTAKAPAQHDAHSDATKSPDSKHSKAPAGTNQAPAADSKDSKPTADAAKSPAQHDAHSDTAKSPDSKDSKPPAGTNQAPAADSKDSKPPADGAKSPAQHDAQSDPTKSADSNNSKSATDASKSPGLRETQPDTMKSGDSKSPANPNKAPQPNASPATDRTKEPPPTAPASSHTGPPPNTAAPGTSRSAGPPPSTPDHVPSRTSGPPPTAPDPAGGRSAGPPPAGTPAPSHSGPPPAGNTPPPSSPPSPPPAGRSK
ncbi:MAG TPA: toxin glutamine deamidase domain-containing protein [Bryobacteraceae bacterium]|nr:toxin glutamine deamidase domain-containing protein [Bryobacteraceae bacterium]